MRDQANYKYPVSSQYVWIAIAELLKTDPDSAQKFIMDCVNEFDLFENDGEFLWSPSFLRRMEKKDEKSIKARESASKRWNNEGNATVMQTHSKRNAIKEKKSKVDKKKVPDIPEGGDTGKGLDPPADILVERDSDQYKKVQSALFAITQQPFLSATDSQNIELALKIAENDADFIVSVMERKAKDYEERESKKPEILRKKIKCMAYFLDGLKDAVITKNNPVTRSGTSPPVPVPDPYSGYDAATNRVLSMFEGRTANVRSSETG
jgi:hypothetical protein